MSTSNISYRLRVIVTGIFIILFTVVALTVIFLYQVSQSQADHYALLYDLRQLENESEKLQSRGEYYVANAPRDYETYFRDVAVYHREMQSDIQLMEDQFQSVVQRYHEGSESLFASFSRFVYVNEWIELGAAVNLSSEKWRQFRQGLTEALGENKKEPRLEWAAGYIVNHSGDVSAELGSMISAYRNVISTINTKVRRIALISVISTGIVLIIGLALMQRIVMRIGATAKACDRVANGDFGYQLPEASRDELGQMTRAFNSLSGRVRLVLGLLTKLNTTREPGSALDAFWADSRAYFEPDWIGLTIQTTDGSSLVLTHQKSLSPAAVKNWNHRKIDLRRGPKLEQQIADHLNRGEALLVDNINNRAPEISGSPFFRELIQKTMPSSVVVLPLVNHDKSWKAALVIAKGIHKPFNVEQLSLLNNLSPVIGSIFANATSNKTVKSTKDASMPRATLL